MTWEKIKPMLIAGVVAALVALASGCGSSSSSSSSLGSTDEEAAAGTSAEFLKPKSPNNKYVTFGSEASGAERKVASKVLDENLKAREEGDFATQCATLALEGVEALSDLSTKGTAAAAECPKALKKLAEPFKRTEKIRTDTLDGPIAAFRVSGSKGVALYHGNDQKDYAMKLTKEGGNWKVASVLTIELG